MNNKVLTKIAELNLQNDRAKQDLAKQFPKDQQKHIWIYKLVKHDNPQIPFIANTAENAYNIAGVEFVKESTLYIESEFKDLFNETDSQLQLIDNRNVYGYIKDDLNYSYNSYIIKFDDIYSESDDLKSIFMIDNNNQYDELNLPGIERVQIKTMVEELGISRKIKWKLVPAEAVANNSVKEVAIAFKQSSVGLSSIDINSDETPIEMESKDTYLPYPILPVSVVNKSVDVYAPLADPYYNMIANNADIFGNQFATVNLRDIKTALGNALYLVYKNIISICHMVQNGFSNVQEQGYAPGNPGAHITPSAGWYWKERLQEKEPKALAAEIQNLIDLNLQALQAGEVYGAIDSNNVNGNIIDTGVQIPTTAQYKAFYSALSMTYPQIFSNYTTNYGGSFDADGVLPIGLLIPNSEFKIRNDGSFMWTIDDDVKLTKRYNFGTTALQSHVANFSRTSGMDIFYYESSGNSIGAGQVYIIDFKYAVSTSASLSTSALERLQTQMITSPGAVAIGRPNDWTFVNNSGWRSNVAGSFSIPETVFKTMENPVFYYALTNSQLNDYYDESRTSRDYETAGWSDWDGTSEFHRGYPKVPFAAELKQLYKQNPGLHIDYLVAANSQMRDDAGSYNDYRLTMQDFSVKVDKIDDIFSPNDFKIATGVSMVDTVDGTTPFLRPAANLVASNVAKTAGENTANVLNAPKLFVQTSDLISLFKGELRQYDSLSGAIDKITQGHPQAYEFVRTDTSVHKPLTDIALSTLGAGHFSITIKYEDDTTKVIEGNVSKEGVYDNNLYIDPSEDFIETFTLINFGDE